jgi:hypothetical protein
MLILPGLLCSGHSDSQIGNDSLSAWRDSYDARRFSASAAYSPSANRAPQGAAADNEWPYRQSVKCCSISLRRTGH